MAVMRRRLLAPLVAIGLMVGGCGSGQDAGDQRAADSTQGVEALPVAVQADLRKVVYTSDLTVRVDDAVAATQRATQVAMEAGGLVFSQSSDLEGHKEARLTLKVPPERFDSVLADLAGLGRALKRDVKARDVTEEVVDIDGRLKTAQASADRLRALIGDARSTADIVAVEGELAKRESEVESLQGRLRVLSSQVDLATINVRLTERGDLAVNREVPPFLKALRAGSVAVLNALLVVVAIAGFTLPFAPFGVLVWWVVRRYRRRRGSLPRPPRPPYGPSSSQPPSPGGGPPEGADAPPESAPAVVG